MNSLINIKLSFMLEIKTQVFYNVTPKGIRIPVASVKGRCPRPLDDGGFVFVFINYTKKEKKCQSSNYFK